MKEKRKIQRIELRTPARLDVMAKGSKKKTLVAETKDISSRGAFFITKDEIEKNTNLDVELLLSMEKFQKLIGDTKQVRLQIRGTVIRNDPDGFAVSFGTKYKIIAIDHGQE